MADNKPQGQFLKIANTVTLVLLLGMTGLLAVQSWRLRQELASHQEPATAPPPPAGLTPAEVAPLPAP
ncbi:MAG TPA: hypothetical protein VNN17_08750, partial [Terriglobia bacterium]|nr:hypothetical protein [Terriglobia bacterium]